MDDLTTEDVMDAVIDVLDGARSDFIAADLTAVQHRISGIEGRGFCEISVTRGWSTARYHLSLARVSPAVPVLRLGPLSCATRKD